MVTDSILSFCSDFLTFSDKLYLRGLRDLVWYNNSEIHYWDQNEYTCMRQTCKGKVCHVCFIIYLKKYGQVQPLLLCIVLTLLMILLIVNSLGVVKFTTRNKYSAYLMTITKL